MKKHEEEKANAKMQEPPDYYVPLTNLNGDIPPDELGRNGSTRKFWKITI